MFVLAYAVADVVVARTGSVQPVLARTAVDLALTLPFFWLLLALTRRTHRFPQTSMPRSASTSCSRRIIVLLLLLRNPARSSQAVAVLVTASFTIFMIWYLLIVGHILRSALDTGLVTGFRDRSHLARRDGRDLPEPVRRRRLMHLHILGICGTFMGGIAALARAAGHRVTGSDANVYPPMSTQLEAQGITLIEGYDPAQLDLNPDVVVVGNVMSRGKPVIERLLDSGLPYVSGPRVARRRTCCAGAKSPRSRARTARPRPSSMLAWILQDAGRDPGFLIGGIPANFGASARAGSGAPFVIEADEYDTAFFDKRAKFVHYRPRHLLLTNLEFDHADIYPDLASIQRQFHHLVRTVPRVRAASPGTRRTPRSRRRSRWVRGRRSRSSRARREAEWRARLVSPDGSAFEVLHRDAPVGVVRWPLIGLHNVENGLAADRLRGRHGRAARSRPPPRSRALRA